jgi:hypothetical protein
MFVGNELLVLETTNPRGLIIVGEDSAVIEVWIEFAIEGKSSEPVI